MKKICIFLIMACWVFACNEPILEEPEIELKSGKMVERTIKFQKASGIMEVIWNEEACSDTKLQMVISGGGNATFLGKFNVENTLCVDQSGNPVSPIMGQLTAANGDKIFTIVLTPPWEENGILHYLYTIRTDLCTGRFENAYGYIIMYGTIDHDTMTWDLKGEGKITF